MEKSRWRASARAKARLSRQSGFWAVAFSFLAVSAFSTAPSALYGLYAHRDHLSSLTITIVYAVYAGGIVVTLVLAGHVSDWYGRRVVLLPALGVAVLAAVVFLVWRSLPGLSSPASSRVSRSASPWPPPPHSSRTWTQARGRRHKSGWIVATIADVGGLGLGALIAACLPATGRTLSRSHSSCSWQAPGCCRRSWPSRPKATQR